MAWQSLLRQFWSLSFYHCMVMFFLLGKNLFINLENAHEYSRILWNIIECPKILLKSLQI